eukprot:TRINITY_DN11386_c0_g1_i4.p1 TRINITY_DN11386_c0_g1~~TRINITY_DN11386_c0_g1_i4.p1  ORF type:complete len:351 (+),score=70.66 TRINITY_DN11386_c0_g1_i4:28-1053(+)
MRLDSNAGHRLSDEREFQGQRRLKVAFRALSIVVLAFVASLFGSSSGFVSGAPFPQKSARRLYPSTLAASGASQPDSWEDGRRKRPQRDEDEEEDEEMGLRAGGEAQQQFDDWEDEDEEEALWSDAEDEEDEGEDEEDEAFWPEEDSEENVAASSEDAAIEVADQSEKKPKAIPADIQRQKLWDMPKDALPLMLTKRVSYVSREKRRVSADKLINRVEDLDFVVLKARNADRMIERSEKLIKWGSMGSNRLKRMKEWGREHFGKDIPMQRNKDGKRAFRYRSGMRDLREVSETESYQRRKKDLRPPDHKRKRRRPDDLLKSETGKWAGSDKRYWQGKIVRR